MQKAADAFRTISEVADDLSLPQHVLRFWETRFPQIRPLKRAGGRRYYRPADVTLLQAIRRLLYDEGYTIKGVQRVLKEQGARGASVTPPTAPIPAAAIPAAADALDEDGRDIDADEMPPAAEETRAARHTPRSGITGGDRAAVEDALATVEACKAILEAVLRGPVDPTSPREGCADLGLGKHEGLR